MAEGNESSKISSLIIIKGHIPSEFNGWEGDPWLKVRPERASDPFWPYADDDRSTKVASFAIKVHRATVIERKQYGGDVWHRATVRFLGSAAIESKEFGLSGTLYPEGGGRVALDPEPEFTPEGNLVLHPALALPSFTNIG